MTDRVRMLRVTMSCHVPVNWLAADQLRCDVPGRGAPHQGGPLGEGSIEDGWLRCPWHGYDYDPITGLPPEGFSDGVAAYQVEERSDGAFVRLPASAPKVRTVADVLVETLVRSPTSSNARQTSMPVAAEHAPAVLGELRSRPLPSTRPVGCRAGLRGVPGPIRGKSPSQSPGHQRQPRRTPGPSRR